uniref:Toll-like receptor 9 n=1 Tax=Oryzias latipes TaxID=8090 RepID=A0A3P9JPW0_ORYLA
MKSVTARTETCSFQFTESLLGLLYVPFASNFKLHLQTSMASVTTSFILLHLFTFGNTINTNFLPCEADVNSISVDCSFRPLKYTPSFQSSSVLEIKLSYTKIKHVGHHAFAGVPNLKTLRLMGNCEPDRLGTVKSQKCRVEIHHDAFKNLQNLTSLYLSKNSMTSIPLLPASLQFLDLQLNCIINIIHPLNTPNLHTLLLSKNCFYANPCNQSLYISTTVFRGLPNLKNLSLGYNNLTSVPKGLPPSLTSLDLRENTITEVLKGAFSHLTALETLNLEWNCQRCDHAARPCFPCPNNLPLHLHPEAFYSENSSISFLSLRGNSLKTVPPGLFKHLKKLKGLDLSDNLLAYEIRNGTFFEELTGLTWISLIYNYEPLKTFSELILSPHISKISGLQSLLLSGNFFLKLSNDSFKVLSTLRNLTKLELRMNFISACNLTSLKKLSLKEVDLSQNMLNFLPCCSKSSSGIVDQETCQNQNFYTDHVHEQIPIVVDREKTSRADTWKSNQHTLPETGENNEFKIQQPWDFKKKLCHQKLDFDLSQNDLLSLNNRVFVGLENVGCLDLSLNYMSQTLKGGMFDGMKKLVFLNMSFNRLDLYDAHAFSELKSTLKLLDVSNNDFHFKMRGMGHSFMFLKNLTSLEVLSLANNGIGMRIDQRLLSNSLKYLYFSGNHLDIMWGSDNNKYTHFFQNLTKLIYLDISNNGLKSVSEQLLINLPVSIKGLSISNNLLYYFSWQNISRLSNLCHLNLSRNSLTYLPPQGADFGPFFSLLDLSHNHFTFIPENFFSKATSLKYLYLNHNQIKALNNQHLPALFKNGSSLHELTLHDNPFQCYCDTSWLADFLRTTSIQIPHLTTHVLCEFPESQQGKSLLFMDQRSCQDIYGSLAFLICSFFTIVLTVVPLLKHLYGWDVWYCLQVLWAGHKGYSKLPGNDSCHHYDAFVVFDTRNGEVRDWVYNELTVNLEKSGNRRFCLCLEERDWIPGISCIDNLHMAVKNSGKTVFVLAKGAHGAEMINGVMQQAFFMVQQRLLDEKMDTAILVLLDETFPKLKYLQLRKRLCRKSVLSWPINPKAQPLFWNQMRVALALDNLKLYDSNMSESFI